MAETLLPVHITTSQWVLIFEKDIKSITKSWNFTMSSKPTITIEKPKKNFIINRPKFIRIEEI